ncbi:MAG: murein L,D-transpeptidase [Solirubrobacterales bacterium]|nr:murein L,D-transpeptidase [Solirubrobacterales bacterium]
MRTTPVVLSAAVFLLALPASALAQAPEAPTPVAPPVAAPAPVPAAVAGALKLRAEKVGSRRTVLAGARWRVRGILTPYVAGQQVVVRYYRGGKKLKAKQVTLRKSGDAGVFLTGFTTKGAGRVTVRATHRGTAKLKTVKAHSTSVDVLPRYAGPGSSSSTIRALQARLDSLGYVVGRRGSFDARTGRAVLAFRKNTGMARTTVADRSVFSKLAKGQGAFKVKYPNHGRHIETDISKQVVALIGKGGKVERIYPTSTGAPSTPTIRGSFKVYRKDFGTNALGMVHAAYFIRGYAIHGFKSVPTYNASHGCLRVPTPDALDVFRWVRYGTRVDTYE